MNILNRVALKTLMKNKTRTWVTIIGIVLSAAMFTAVTTCVSSLQNYMLELIKATDGVWHGAEYSVGAEDLAALRQRDDIKRITALENTGYALIGSKNEYKPYLMIQGMDDQTAALLPLHLISGRLPEQEGEILLPKHLSTNGGVNYALGDRLELELGARTIDGEPLNQQNSFVESERFTPRLRCSYTVVGFYERPTFESYSAPGYTALTIGSAAQGDYDVYIEMKNMSDIYALLEESAYANTVNSELLRYSGSSRESSFNSVLYSMAAILIAIIVFGSISLIYNAFSISVSERTRQFGILKSIGATNRQIHRSVLFEALVLSAAGIPLGVLSGIAGIGITLRCTGGLFEAMDLTEYGVALDLHVSVPSIVIAAAIGLITVLVSAWLPARKAIRRSAIDSIRQTGDVAIRARRVKSAAWVYRLFGFEGMLANKNFKRNRKKYRATVLSLFLSVVLFISASSFCSYMNRSVNALVEKTDWDITYGLELEETDLTPAQMQEKMLALKAVTDVEYAANIAFSTYYQDEDLNPDYLNWRNKQEELEEGSDGSDMQAQEREAMPTRFVFLEDQAYERWLRENKLDPQAFGFAAEPRAVALDFLKYWDHGEQKYYSFPFFGKNEVSYSFTLIPETVDDFRLVDSRNTDGEKNVYIYENETGERREYAEDDPLMMRSGTIGARLSNGSLGIALSSYMPTLVYPLSVRNTVLSTGREMTAVDFYIKSSSPKTAEADLHNLLTELNLSADQLYNVASQQESERALVGIVNIFSYGFIILISLIALANVFNTISTNISLRRREFAMLKSVGMTQRGFNRMMNYECILYGAKGLIYGLPAAVAVTFFIYRSILNGWETSFYLPWYSVAIAVCSVFLVVFATMLYSMRKIKKDNPIDALKNENL